MFPVWFMLPLPSCLFAIGSLVHCVMFSLVIFLSCDYQFCLLIGWLLSCVQSCLLQVAMSLAVSQYQVRKVRTCVLGGSDFVRLRSANSRGREDTSPVILQMEQQHT